MFNKIEVYLRLLEASRCKLFLVPRQDGIIHRMYELFLLRFVILDTLTNFFAQCMEDYD